MLTELQEEQASLYALDLLDSHEVTAFQREMLAKPELQLLVEEFRLCRDVVVLEAAPAAPPPQLRQKILSSLELPAGKPSSSPAAKTPSTGTAPLSFARLALPWSLAACLSLLAGWLAMERVQMQQQLAQSGDQILQQERSLATLKTRNSSLAETITRLESQNLLQAGAIAQLKATSAQESPWTQSAVSIVWDKTRQQGLLVLSRMPAAEAGKIYQLWVIDPAAEGPVSAGTFEVQADGTARILFRPSRDVRQATQFAVSLEEGGAKQQPEGPVIMAGTSL